jgi:hypothetical protein
MRGPDQRRDRLRGHRGHQFADHGAVLDEDLEVVCADSSDHGTVDQYVLALLQAGAVEQSDLTDEGCGGPIWVSGDQTVHRLTLSGR